MREHHIKFLESKNHHHQSSSSTTSGPLSLKCDFKMRSRVPCFFFLFPNGKEAANESSSDKKFVSFRLLRICSLWMRRNWRRRHTKPGVVFVLLHFKQFLILQFWQKYSSLNCDSALNEKSFDDYDFIPKKNNHNPVVLLLVCKSSGILESFNIPNVHVYHSIELYSR